MIACQQLRRAACSAGSGGGRIAAVHVLDACMRSAARHSPRAPAHSQQHLRRFHIAFFGTDDVSLPTLRCLHAESITTNGQPPLISSITVICPGDRPAGRGRKLVSVPVRAFAREHGLHTIEVPYGIKKLRDFPPPAPMSETKFDIGVVVSFGYFITEAWLNPLRRGAINMHPSLLPKVNALHMVSIPDATRAFHMDHHFMQYRGSAPIPHAILSGDTRTGISIIDIHKTKFDAGGILRQEVVEILPDETASSLTQRLATRGADCVIEVLRSLKQGDIPRLPQSDAATTPAPKLCQVDGAICWSKAPSVDAVMRQYRALHSSYGVHCDMIIGPQHERLRVNLVELRRTAADEVQGLPARITMPGTLAYVRKRKLLFVRASDGWLVVQQIQLEKRKVVSGHDFAVGYHITDDGRVHLLDSAIMAPIS